MPATLPHEVRPSRPSLGGVASSRALAVLSAICNLLWLGAWLGGAASWVVAAGAAIAAAGALAFAASRALHPPSQPALDAGRSALTSTEVFVALDSAVGRLGAHLFDWDLLSNTLAIDDTRLANCSSEPTCDAEQFLASLLHADDQTRFRTEISAALQGGTTFQIEFRALHADASVHLVEMHGHVLRAKDGAPARILGAIIDIGQQRILQQALADQTLKLAQWFESYDLAARVADLSVWDWDLTTNQLATDRNMLRIFDRESAPPASNAQEFLHDILHAEDRADFFAAFTAAVKDRSRFDVEHCFRYVRSNGEVRHAHLVGRLIRDANGWATRLLGISWNITAQVVATQEIARQAAAERDLLERLNLATQAAGIKVWEWDLLTDHLMMDVDVLSRYGTNQTGGNGNALANIRAAIHPDDLADFDAAGVQAMQAPGAFKNRYRVCRLDGQYRHVETITRVLRNSQAQATRVLGVTRDITEEVEHAQLLVRQAEHERALTDRLSIASEAAGIGTWEICLQAQSFLWVENPIHGLADLFNGKAVSLADFSSRVHPDDRMLLPNALRDAFRANADRVSCRYRVYGADGAVLHVVSYGRLIPDAEGRMVRMLGVSWHNTREVETAQLLEEQARAERKLRTRVAVSAQAAGIASWELDLTQHRLVWHENFSAELLARGSDHVLDVIISLQHPDDRDVFNSALRQALRNGDPVMQYRYRLRNGDQYRHHQNFARLVFDERNQPLAAIGVSWDITPEVQAAEEFQRQAEQLRVIEGRLERASLSSSEGHFEWDLLTQTAWWSSSFHALLGYAEGSLPAALSESLALLQLPEDLQWQRAKFDAHIKHNVPYRFEARLRTSRGELRWFSVLGTAERDQQGRALRMAGSIHDIHQQRLAEDALQLAQQRLERAITGTQDGLWELEASGTAWCSPRVAELLGYAADELPGDTNFLQAFLHEADRESVAAATQAHFHQAAPYDVEVRLRTRSGEYRWYRARASAERNAQQQPLRLSGSLQDVTDARTARQALVNATEAAQAASRAKSDFLANVSHEIRTPMNGIVGMTHLLLDTSLDRAQQDYAEIIRSSADSLLAVINDILDFSKAEAGKLDIEKIEMDLRTQVEEVGAMLALQAPAKQIELIVNVRPEVPQRVLGDPQRVRQCLVNLLGNALKFTLQGEVVVEVGIIGRQDGKPLVHFEVRDTGIGIAETTLETLFQPFVQADSSTTRHFGGTGLGLSIVRRLTEMMGGTVGAASKLGTGSTFWFTLPMEEVTAAAMERVDAGVHGRPRILVVDDNRTCLDVIAAHLQYSGFEVACVSHADGALDLLRRSRQVNQPFDIALIDHKMPEMAGHELGRRIKADPELAVTHLVLLSSLVTRAEGERLIDPGFAAHLSKPVRCGELLACLQRLIEAPQQGSQAADRRNAFHVRRASDRRYQGRVLLTEDNPVNQKVALRFLQRLGLTVTIANNGAEAYALFTERSFDLILMDLQMPVMDGLSATRAIRQSEADSGKPPTPIVALTANAMLGQHESCLAGGMNAFLTKPLNVERLVEILEQYLLPKSFASASLEPLQSPLALVQTLRREIEAAAAEPSSPVDLAGWAALTDQDPDFECELAETFVASTLQVLAEMRAAHQRFDGLALARAAHKLRGASANMHALGLRDLAAALEGQAATAAPAVVNELLMAIESSCQLTMQFFAAYMRSAPSASSSTIAS